MQPPAAAVPTAPLPPAQPPMAADAASLEAAEKAARDAADDAAFSEAGMGADRASREQAVADRTGSRDDADELLEDLDPLEIEDEVRERIESLGPAAAPARSIEAGIDAMLNADPGRTLPPRAPANDVQAPKQRRRRGDTAYSVNQVDEEDVYGTGRMPKPGRTESGGRSGR
jgi:hypothetical protein